MTLAENPHVPATDRPAPRRRGVAAAAAAALLVGGVGVAVGTQLGDPQDATSSTPSLAPSPPVAEQEDEQQAAPAISGDALSWAPPELEDPEVIEISDDDTGLKLDDSTDYELIMPDEPLTKGLGINGGRNVVLIGGEVRIDEDEDEDGRGLFLRAQTGTVHVEGLLLSGVKEGINIDQRKGAVVQLQNIRVDEVRGSFEGHHADLLQIWAGPRQLLVDGFSGSTNYQGFFLLPQQFGDQPEPELFDLRRIDITGADDGSAYMLWRDDNDWPLQTQDVWVDPSDDDPEDRRAFLWDREGEDSWEDVSVGSPPDGSFVPEGVAGLDYVSPGYGADE